jgi:hypothetical protein
MRTQWTEYLDADAREHARLTYGERPIAGSRTHGQPRGHATSVAAIGAIRTALNYFLEPHLRRLIHLVDDWPTRERQKASPMRK